jgi:L-lactate dehydrogenase complex protein LldG
VSAAREAILGRVHAALGDARRQVAPLPAYRRAGGLQRAERVELFATRVADYRAEVRQVADVAAAVADVAGGGVLGVPAGLSAAWRPPGWVQDDGLSIAELDGLDGVVTGCTVAIAETGTLVLSGRPEEGRRALTLVPDLHVCIVEPERIVETVPEAFDRLAGSPTRPLTFVSGPSATSDIELRRVEGVHGPRRLVVVIVEGGADG